MKKYRLMIPEKINKNEFNLLNFLFSFDGKVIDENWKFHGKVSGTYYDIDSIPSEWLEEIKDEPMSAEESWEECQYCCDMDYSQTEWKSIFLEGFHAGAAENEKKHRAQYTCKDAWWDKWQSMPDNAFKHGWNECLKSHNLPGEE